MSALDVVAPTECTRCGGRNFARVHQNATAFRCVECKVVVWPIASVAALSQTEARPTSATGAMDFARPLPDHPYDEQYDTQTDVERDPCGAWMAIQHMAHHLSQPETCGKCDGSGLQTNDAGEPGLCTRCHGDTVVTEGGAA